MIIGTSVQFQLSVVDVVTGRIVRQSPRQKNLVLNTGLNSLARGTNASASNTATTYAHVGSGSTSDKTASGAITFTQAGTTLTASAPFFTAGMQGALFKWGTGSGGNERVITVFTNSTTVTVNVSETVAVPDVGTVWMVNRTTLETELFRTNTYQTNSGDCQSSWAGNTLTHKRTYIVAQQGSPYTVNEVGWGSVNSTTIFGRAVLGASVVVGTSNFLVIVIELSLTITPGTPTAVGDVGTNINTAGNAMIEQQGAFGTVNSNGSAATGAFALETTQSGSCSLVFATATYTQNSAITSGSGPAPSTITTHAGVAWANDATTTGRATLSFSSGTATTGQSLFGMGIVSSGSSLRFDVKFTSTQTAPTGTFTPVTVFSIQFGQTLTN